MLISLNELKKLVKIDLADEELFKLIGSRLVEIEHVEDLAPKYKKIYVVKVLKAEPIEGTHLHLCQIDAGKELNDYVDPEHSGYIQVVCGAPNVKKGMLTAWVAPGAIVPSTYDTAEPFEISARPLRGFMSHGMLAAADELALGEDHAGIIELDPALEFPTYPTFHENLISGKKQKIAPGQLLADVLELNDKIIEVENKSLTHRPDCFGLVGFAREVAGILGQPYGINYLGTATKAREAALKNSDQAKPSREAALNDQAEPTSHESSEPEPEGAEPLKLPVNISDFGICPRYEALVFEFDNLPEKSPYLTPNDIFLIKAGMRPISPIVDATNLIMLKTGQPLHAFDYDKFVKVGGSASPEIRVRLARNGEKLTLLDDKEIGLTTSDIVICSGDTPVALAGAMGGKSTEIDEHTQKILVEVASFSLYNLRKTQMAHGIFSEAITRFTKGRPAADLLPAVLSSIHYFAELDGRLIGLGRTFDPQLDQPVASIKITAGEINSLLGSDYSEELIIKTLKNTEFEVKKQGATLEVAAPVWRADIHIKEDIIEEVGRLLGFDNIPLDFPHHPFVCPTVDPMFEFKSKLRTVLSDRLGMNETLTYSFVSKTLQEKAGEDPEDSYRIVNSLSPELECFRQSLLPSLLDKLHDNDKAGFKDFTLYELNQVSKKSWGLNEENVPKMQTEFGLVTFGDFYAVKHILRELEKSLNLRFELKPLDASNILEPLHSVAIYLNNEQVGELGEVKTSVLKRMKIAQTVSALRLTLDPCLDARNAKKFGIKLSKFPSVSRDLTVSVPINTNYADVEAKIIQVLSNISATTYKLEPVSIYKKGITRTKNLSFHLEITNDEKTLESSEVSDIIETIVKELQTLGAEVV